MNAIPVHILRRLARELAEVADEIDATTNASTFDVDEASEREGFSAGLRCAVDALQVEVLGDAGEGGDT